MKQLKDTDETIERYVCRYSVQQVRIENGPKLPAGGVRILQLRNPWGSLEWKGSSEPSSATRGEASSGQVAQTCWS